MPSLLVALVICYLSCVAALLPRGSPARISHHPFQPAAAANNNKSWAYFQAAGPFKVKNAKLLPTPPKDFLPCDKLCTNGENCCQMWYPTSVPKGIWLGSYVFCMGTGAYPEEYEQIAQHVASHGFVVLVLPMYPEWVTVGVETVIRKNGEGVSGFPSEIKGRLAVDFVVTGGHSGGGPYAADYAGNNGAGHKWIRGVIAQHAAAIPDVNKPSS